MTDSVCEFIAENRDRFGVAPICRVLSENGVPIAPRTLYAWVRRAPSKRARGTPPSPRFWLATTNPATTVVAARSRCTGR
jgi:hypothetical protein